jgi:hypothetical protein
VAVIFWGPVYAVETSAAAISTFASVNQSVRFDVLIPDSRTFPPDNIEGFSQNSPMVREGEARAGLSVILKITWRLFLKAKWRSLAALS